MKTLTNLTKHLVSVTVALSFAALLHADYITGTGWSVPASTANDTPTTGNVPGPGATEWVTFAANGINFSGDAVGAYNLGGFLNSGGVASSIAYFNGASPGTSLDNTEWEFTGSAFFTNGESFNVVHDDGVNMYVNGSAVLLDPGPTAPVTSSFTYTGPTGTFAFDFIYTECCLGTADFQTTLVPSAPATPPPATGTPEPGSFALSALGLGGGLIVLARRRLQKYSEGRTNRDCSYRKGPPLCSPQACIGRRFT
jgi:hypothetical protein